MFFSEMTARDAFKLTKQKMTEYQTEFFERMNAIEVDAHWFRRVFHTFAASFLFYYLLPDEEWINLGKIVLPIIIVLCMIVIEYRRIRGDLDHQRFFGLRNYEKKRPASYLYFGVAILLLFLLFPQQIAIPCILCASIADPIMGEVRQRFGQKKVYLVGFLICMIFFLVTWYKADFWVVLIVSLIGATGAVIGETKKIKWLDDDFMIQMVPAILLLIVWFLAGFLGLVLPDPVIHPGVLPW